MKAAIRNRNRAGFTLVELLMVVLIISILVAILMPVIISAMKTSLTTKLQTRVNVLSTGATQFRADNSFYPGQFGQGKADLAAGMTGSQILAKALFADKDGSNFPKTGYAQYQSGDTLDKIAGKDNTITDCWPKGQAMAILYYPSRLGAAGMAQFVAADNDPYTVAANVASTMANAIANPSLSGSPYRDGQFLLIGAGQDRKYFSADDVTNFGAQ